MSAAILDGGVELRGGGGQGSRRGWIGRGTRMPSSRGFVHSLRDRAESSCQRAWRCRRQGGSRQTPPLGGVCIILCAYAVDGCQSLAPEFNMLGSPAAQGEGLGGTAAVRLRVTLAQVRLRS